MKFPSRDGWAKFGFEGGLIIVSILLAFSIESWRNEHELRVEEQRVLRQLKAEFQANVGLLERRRKDHERIAQSAEWILSITGPSQEDRSIDGEAFYRSVYTATDWFTFDPQSGVLQSLVQSGRLDVIESQSLRTMLAAWPSIVRDIVEDEEASREFSLGPLTTYLAENAPLRNIQSVGLRDSYTSMAVGPSAFSKDIDLVLSDPVFENLVHHKFWLTQVVISEYSFHGPTIEEIVSAIEGEIEN